MAIIYSYPKTAPLAADLLIVSRQPSDPDETANYSVSVSDIATLVTGLQQYTLKAGRLDTISKSVASGAVLG